MHRANPRFIRVEWKQDDVEVRQVFQRVPNPRFRRVELKRADLRRESWRGDHVPIPVTGWN